MRHLIAILIHLVVLIPIAAAQPHTIDQTSMSGTTSYVPLVFGFGSTASNLPVSSATYLGGTANDSVSVVDVAQDSTILIGGTFPGYIASGVEPRVLIRDGAGAIIRLDQTGRVVRSIVRIGGTINDLEISQSGNMIVCGDWGVALIDSTASLVLWHDQNSAVSRCAIAGNDVAVALANGRLTVYTSGGTPLHTINVGGTAQTDVAIDGASGTVIATGYTQTSSDLQVAFMRGWASDGTLKWTSYGFSDANVKAQNLLADTRGERVSIGRDRLLYFAGSINGGTGASIFARDPQNVASKLGSDRNIETDNYNRATNVGSVKMAWFGRYDPASGALLQGSSLLTRRDDGRGNSISIKAITADERSRVYLAGDAAYQIQNRNTQQVAGVTVGPYALGEPYVAVLSADLQQRLVWTTFTGSTAAGGSPATAIGVRNAVAAIGVTRTAGSLITANALQPALGGGSDGYVAVWQP